MTRTQRQWPHTPRERAQWDVLRDAVQRGDVNALNAVLDAMPRCIVEELHQQVRTRMEQVWTRMEREGMLSEPWGSVARGILTWLTETVDGTTQ
jgi:hypothetical protein